MKVEIKHTSLYWEGKQLPTGYQDIPEAAAKHFSDRGLLVILEEQKELEVSTPDQKQVLKDKIKAAGGEVPKGNASEDTLQKALDAALAKTE